MRRFVAVLVLSIFACFSLAAQSYQHGKVIRWDKEAYAAHGNVTRNAAVYYIQTEHTTYQVTRGTTKPVENLASGADVQFRIDKDHMFVAVEGSKEIKFTIIGSEAQP